MDDRIAQKVTAFLQYETREHVLADLAATNDHRIAQYAIACDDPAIIYQLLSSRIPTGNVKISDLEALQATRKWKFKSLTLQIGSNSSKHQYTPFFNRMCLLKSISGIFGKIHDAELRTAILNNNPKGVQKALLFNANAARKLNDNGSALDLFLEQLEHIGNQKDCYHDLKRAKRIEKILLASLKHCFFVLIRNAKVSAVQRMLDAGVDPEAIYDGNSALGFAKELVASEHKQWLPYRTTIVKMLETAIEKRKSAEATYFDTCIINQIRKKIESIEQAHPFDRPLTENNIAACTHQQPHDAPQATQKKIAPEPTLVTDHPRQELVPNLLIKAAKQLENGAGIEDAFIINAMDLLKEAIWHGVYEIHGADRYKYYWLLKIVGEYVKKRPILDVNWIELQNEIARERAELALRKLSTKNMTPAIDTTEIAVFRTKSIPLPDLMARAKDGF